MTQQYALFFDIDGTLVSFQTHEIPASTILALTQAKANGSRVYIATGRPPLIITNLGAIESLIDGYITTNGALCYVGDEMVTCQPIAKDCVMTCVEDCRERGNSLIVIGRKDVAVLDAKGDVDRIFRQMLAVKNLDKASPLDVVLQQDIRARADGPHAAMRLGPLASGVYRHHRQRCRQGQGYPGDGPPRGL